MPEVSTNCDYAFVLAINNDVTVTDWLRSARAFAAVRLRYYVYAATHRGVECRTGGTLLLLLLLAPVGRHRQLDAAVKCNQFGRHVSPIRFKLRTRSETD